MGTATLIASIAWISISAFQYGYHISSLNSAADAVRTAIGLSTFEFGVVTSAYTLGGLASSVHSAKMIDSWGQKKTAERAACAMCVGALFVTIAHSFWLLTLGRVVIGLACGIATVLVPLYLQTVSPRAIAAKVGILCQISINLGILAAQGISIPFSTPGTEKWRRISFLSVIVAVVQFGTGWLVASPSPAPPSHAYDHPASTTRDEERAPFILPEPDSTTTTTTTTTADKVETLTITEVLASRDESVTRPLKALVATMLFQQFSGINAVMFYSVTILTAVNPASAKATALFVTVVNLVMTFPAVYLIDRVGRRTLVVASLATMSASSAVLAYSINRGDYVVASAGILAFVVSFAAGLGPVPFVLLGELPTPEAKSATASIAVASNWISNLVVGIAFLPLRDWLASLFTAAGARLDGDGAAAAPGSGTVFYVFAVVSAVGAVVVGRLLR
ncbi:hypothetical protein JCM11491_000326 [Sporobolomyces phaffii]